MTDQLDARGYDLACATYVETMNAAATPDDRASIHLAAVALWPQLEPLFIEIRKEFE